MNKSGGSSKTNLHKKEQVASSSSTDKEKGLREIFADLLDCNSPKEQEALLEQVGRQNPNLRDQVKSMLEDHRKLDDFLLTPVLGDRTSRPPLLENLSGTKLGPYELIRVIGEGGGGTVYLAVQKDPVKRQVALKILKTGANSANVLDRFEAERHTLAMMDHPGIAKVLDAGKTESGRPFFVMEYVDGDPVTEYCDEHHFTIRQRLDVFIKICRALEHAHQKGIIHRDLKPSNILVREEDAKSAPKVIDFGVAKAMDPFEGAPLKLTLNDPIIGTPAYMSPEQAADGRRDIDTRADIYSLGVILFELLTGITPLESALGEDESTGEALALLNQGRFLRPSSYFESLDPIKAVEIAQARSCSPKRLLSEIRGDLDWVVMTCLEKDRDRRYGSSNELARDLELHLEGSPIRARPPSWQYRMGRFISRNRVTVSLSGFLAIALLSTTAVSYLSGVRARRAKETEKDLRLRAEQDRSLAIASSTEARLHQYVANINLAHQAISNGHLSKARLLLERWNPEGSQDEDLRGFEWWYLMDRCAEDDHVTLPLLGSPADALSFSPDGRLVAIATRGQVHLWSCHEKRIASTFDHDGKSVEFSGDGRQLLITGREGVIVIDLALERPIWELEGYGQSASFSPDGSRLATTGADGTYMWNTKTWTREKYFALAADALLFSPITGVLAAQTNEGITLLAPEESKAPVMIENSTRSFPGKHVFRFSPDGRFFVFAKNEDPSPDGFAIALCDVENGREIELLARSPQSDRHNGRISEMGFDREGKYLVTGSRDHSVRIWDFNKGKLKRKLLGHRSEVLSVAFSPDGLSVASGSKDGEVRIWPTQQQIQQPTINGAWVPLEFLPPGNKLVGYHASGKLGTFDLETGEMVGSNPAPALTQKEGFGIPVDQKKSTRVERIGPGLIKVTHLGDQTTVTISSDLKSIDSLTLSPDGLWLAATNMRKGLRCWNLKSPENPIIANEASVALFTNDGKSLVTLAKSGLVISYATSNGLEKGRFQLQPFEPGSRFALSPNGSILAATLGFRDYENAIIVLDSQSGKELGLLKGHKQGIWNLSFSPDGRTLASSGSGGTIRLWNVATETELFAIRRSGTSISNLNFSPDGGILIAGSPAFSKNPGLQIYRGLPKNSE